MCAVLVDLLIDKGIISQDEVFDRLQGARAAGEGRSGCVETTRALASAAAPQAPALSGETVLVVEEEDALAHELLAELEDAGAEVLVARGAAEALSRIGQFEFSVAVLDWRPDRSECRALARRLREDGVRLLLLAASASGDAAAASGNPMLLKPARAGEIVRALAQPTGRLQADLGAA